MITKLERTSSAKQKDLTVTQNTHNEWDSASTNSHQIGIHQRLRESSQQGNIWKNTIGPYLSVIPGHSTSPGQCSPLGRKDKECKRPRH